VKVEPANYLRDLKTAVENLLIEGGSPDFIRWDGSPVFD
jgi:hypothetical protein